MSHLGMGEAFGSFLLMALLAVAVIFVVRMVPAAQAAGRAEAGRHGLHRQRGRPRAGGLAGQRDRWEACLPVPPSAPVLPTAVGT
jgi:hypothetical protein